MKTPSQTSNVEVGSVIAIPVDDMLLACKVIWLSTRSRDVMGLVVLPGVYDDLGSARFYDGTYQFFTVMGEERLVMYADRKNVTRRKLWPIIGSLPLTPLDHDLMTHQIGAGLWQGDDFLRNLSPQEQGAYPKMLVAGNGAVENFLRQIIARQR